MSWIFDPVEKLGKAGWVIGFSAGTAKLLHLRRTNDLDRFAHLRKNRWVTPSPYKHRQSQDTHPGCLDAPQLQGTRRMATVVPLRSLTPQAQVLGPGFASLPVLRRPGSVSSGSTTPQNASHFAPRILPPSGASTPAQPSSLACPAQPDVCASCGWVYMPDAVFCRHCGQKRDMTQAEASPAYVSAASPMPEVYAGDGFTYGSGAASPFPPGVTVYASEPTPAYCSTSGTVSPLPAAYADEGAVYGWSGAATALPPRVLATKLSPSAYDTSGVARLASGQATWMEPTTVANQHVAPVSMSVPAGSSTDAPAATLSAISNGISSNGYASTRISSYAPAMPSVQVAGGASCVLPAVMHPRASTPTVPARYSIASPAAPRASVSGSSTPVVPVGSQWGTVSPLPPAPAMVLGAEPSAPVEPQVPPSLTAGLPDPTSIERQKSAYSRGLDDQLKHGTEVLAQQLKQQSDNLFAMGDQRKRQYALQVDQEIKQREMELAQQHNEQLLLLQQAAQQQKSALEHQANALLLEFNQKKAQEDLAYQQYQFQKQQYETQLQYNDEMKELQAQQHAASAQVAQQRAFIAQQAVQASQQAAATAQQVRVNRASGGPPMPITFSAGSYSRLVPAATSATTACMMSNAPHVPQVSVVQDEEPKG
ncbi:hypothetical protein AK812_SmicGene42558 [Symbiodinium microadriaticum]|uniref:Uncharacterized protein n=1 Tax=Symbiodinium microadriaticum TaxID=2951 RepID=A0A1Q9C390_SYMMI|nr:hypothetical protein AK812_SmicGene42558 [Symbiodinium microadriaticum]